jgi:chloramphenicol-sensitive protein RarD
LLIGTAFFLFAWAFLHGDAAHVAQAYLLLPFSMSLTGLLLFGEQLRPLQWLGFGLAAVGVTHELTVHGVISWVTIVQTSSLTSYFVLHRYLHQRGCTPMQLLVAEFWLLFPVAIGCLWIEAARIKPFLSSIEGMAVMMGLWIVTALAYVSYIVSNRYLSCAAFGLWGNLEPVLILLGSVLLFGEPLHRSDLYTYLPMLLGTLLVVW